MDDLRQENKRLKQENRELRERVAAAETKITEQSHSSWPSSRDKSRKKPRSKNLRLKTGRKAGGQKGHRGQTLKFNPEPDVIERHRPVTCENCQSPISNDVAAEEITKRQVFELPSLRFINPYPAKTSSSLKSALRI